MHPAATFRLTLAAAFEFLQHAGWLGYAFHIVAFSLWVSLSLPTTIIELATGFLYGPLFGFLCGICCKTIGQMNAFLVVMTLRKRRGWQVPESLKPRLQAIRSRPLLAMVSVRLAPLPLGVKNYGLALCEVDFVPYMLAGMLVNMPFSILWALTGASCQSLGEALELRGSYSGSSGKVVGTVAVLAVAAFAIRQLRSRFESSRAPADAPRAGDATGVPCK